MKCGILFFKPKEEHDWLIFHHRIKYKKNIYILVKENEDHYECNVHAMFHALWDFYCFKSFY